MRTISFNYTYVFPVAILLCVYKYDVYGLAPFIHSFITEIYIAPLQGY